VSEYYDLATNRLDFLWNYSCSIKRCWGDCASNIRYFDPLSFC